MSEGKYGHLPKPKDRSRGVRVSLGDVTLRPTHDKASEWEEEDDERHEHPKKAPEESMLAKVGRMASEVLGSASRPWARLMKDDEEKE